MKWLLATFLCLLIQTQVLLGTEVDGYSDPVLQDDCLNCVDDIVDAAADCEDAVEPGEIVDCVIDSLQSVSDCLLCVCDVLNIFLNGTNQNCVDDDPGDCIYCAEEINVAIVECSQNDTTDVECAVDALAATSDCLACLCDSLNLVQGGDGECGGPVPTPTTAATTGAGAGTDDKELVLDCADCAADIADAVDACVAAAEGEATDIRCVELAIGATSQCVLCICDVVAVIGGVDQSECDP